MNAASFCFRGDFPSLKRRQGEHSDPFVRVTVSLHAVHRCEPDIVLGVTIHDPHRSFQIFVIYRVLDFTEFWVLPPCSMQYFRGRLHGQISEVLVRYMLSTPLSFAAVEQARQLFFLLPCSHSLLPLPQLLQRVWFWELPHGHKDHPCAIKETSECVTCYHFRFKKMI